MNEVCKDPEIDKITYAFVGAVVGVLASILICNIDNRIPEWLYLVGMGSGIRIGWKMGSREPVQSFLHEDGFDPYNKLLFRYDTFLQSARKNYLLEDSLKSINPSDV